MDIRQQPYTTSSEKDPVACTTDMHPKYLAVNERRRQQQEQDHILHTMSDGKSPIICWETHYSETYQRDYYYNPLNASVSWFAPNVSLAEDDKDAEPEEEKQPECSSFDKQGVANQDESIGSSSTRSKVVFLKKPTLPRLIVTNKARGRFWMAMVGVLFLWTVHRFWSKRQEESVTTAPSTELAITAPTVPSMVPPLVQQQQQPSTDMDAATVNYHVSMSWVLNGDEIPSLMPTKSIDSLGKQVKQATTQSSGNNALALMRMQRRKRSTIRGRRRRTTPRLVQWAKKVFRRKQQEQHPREEEVRSR